MQYIFNSEAQELVEEAAMHFESMMKRNVCIDFL